LCSRKGSAASPCCFRRKIETNPTLTHDPAPSILASGALQFAFEKATIEGKITIGSLIVLSLFSWTIIITKFRQLHIARKWAKRFFAAYGATRDPLDIKRKGEEFEGAPAYQLYSRGADELEFHLRNNPRKSRARTASAPRLSRP